MLTYRALGTNGRLGNQLWQVAATLGLARKHQEAATLPVWGYAPYFNFPDTLFTGAQGTEATDRAEFIPPAQRPYLQDLRCIQAIRDDLRVWLRPSRRALDLLAASIADYDPASATAVHVRRGDYAEDWRGHGMLPLHWYERNWPKGRVLVFTDDPQWCLDNLPGTVVHGADWADWHLMAMCHAHLISNSTFAWWAAWTQGGPVTYPTPWFTALPVGAIVEPHWRPAHR